MSIDHPGGICHILNLSMKESMSSHSSRESLNSRESKENTPRHSRESTPQHQIKDPEFKKPQPIGIKNNRKREEMGVLGHNNNSNIKSNNDLGGSCGSLSSNHSTGTGLFRDFTVYDRYSSDHLSSQMSNAALVMQVF